MNNVIIVYKIYELTYKKSGTALLLFRISRLSHCLLFRTSNTEAHADMYIHIHTIMVRMEMEYISRGHQNAAMRWNSLEFARFRNAKHIARNDAFIMSATAHPKRHNPKAWANYVAKIVNYFQLSK